MKQYSLLLVDDLETNLTILGNLFKKEGYKLFKATDGDEAILMTKKEKPDLILLDIMMPKKDGFQVCKELKRNEETSQIPIIFLTGRDDREDKISGFDLGAVDYITKPFDFREVRARVQSQLLIKQMRDELKEERDKLAEINQFIQLILNSIPTSICVVDFKKRILMVSETFEQVFGLKNENIIGREVIDIFNGNVSVELNRKIQIVAPDELRTIEQSLNKDFEVRGTECRIVIDNDERTFLFHFYKLVQDQYLIDLVDITDRKKMEMELVQQSRLRYIGEVVIGVAHEINNPNTFIRVNNKNVEMILNLMRPLFYKIIVDNPDIKIGNFTIDDAFERIQKASEGIFQASERILMVIERLKNFAKRETLIMELLNIKDIISEAVDLTQYFIEKILDFEINIEDNLPLISGTSIELVQLLVNLITNSFHAIEERIKLSNEEFNKGKISLIAIQDKEKQELVLKIIDNGIGIPMNIQDKIFNPFFTTKPQGKGSGLGLSLCYGIVKRHRGDITFTSIHNQKTEFIIRLPIQK